MTWRSTSNGGGTRGMRLGLNEKVSMKHPEPAHNPSDRHSVDVPPGDPATGGHRLWSDLWHDRVFRIAAGVFAASVVPYALPFLTQDQLAEYARRWVDLPQLAAVGIALGFSFPGRKRETGTTFWTFVALAVASLAAVRLCYVLIPASWWDSRLYVVAGSLYLTSYLMMALAGQANKRQGYEDVATATATGLRIAGATVFLFGLFVYFVVVPEQFGAASDPWVPSFYIYIGLDAYLLIVFASSRLARAGPWKHVYRWFAAWAALLLAADTLEFLMHTGTIPENEYGHPLDFVWMLPHVAMIVAARARHYDDRSLAEALRREPPRWAEPIRAIWQRPLVGYAFAFPLIHFTLNATGLVNPALTTPRETVVSLMLLVLGVMAIAYQNKLERQKREADAAVARYVRLENLIAEMSTHFIGLDPAEIDSGVAGALQRLGEFVGVDRSFVFRFREGGATAECINEWCAEGIESQIDNLRSVRVADYPWVYDRIMRGEVVHVPRVSDLPPEAAAIKLEATREGVLSLINVPMVSSSGVKGFLGFDAVREEKTWSEQSINLLRLVGEMFVNVLERKWAAEERQALEAQLRQSQRVEALGALAGGIAHDLNNMLQPIIGYSELAQYELGEDSPVRAHIDQVHRAATRARGLTRQILDFSRQDYGGAMAPVRLADILAEALRLLRVALPPSVEFAMDTFDPNLFVSGNPGQIHQVILNLGSNAGDAMRLRGGTLRVELTDVAVVTPRLARLGKLVPGGYARISVADSGTGIDPDALRRIFDPFFTTKEKGKGTGLGLTAVWKIVEAHNGAIEVVSDQGGGTTVEIYLPGCDSVEEPPEPAQPGDLSGDERILFVDDEAEIRRLGRQLLEARGYRVVTAADGREAGDMLRAEPDGYDLVITDLNMPRLNGIELTREIRTIRADIPVILATGFMESLSNDMVADLNVDCVVFKPYKADEMRGVVRRALDRARAGAADTLDIAAP